MSKTILVTVSDDRHGRKGGQYEATQNRMKTLLAGFVKQRHYTIDELIDCDPLMANIDSARNGRVYKPWAILQELGKLDHGDYLIYNDCSPELWPEEIDLSKYSLNVIRELTRRNRGFLVAFVKWDDKTIGPNDLGIHTHHYFTLESCIKIMSAEAFRNSFLCASGMICIQKSTFTSWIVERWLYFNRIPECACMNVSELENSYWDLKPGYKLGNRHDQSILSLILNQDDFDYCDIVYNDMNPYNFLNFCLKDHKYNFINSNRT